MLRAKLSNHLSRSRKIGEGTIIRVLDLVSEYVDTKFEILWSCSKRGVPCLRVNGETGNQSWSISIYSDEYIFARVGGTYEVLETPVSTINFVRARLKNLQALQ
jgi:hypothetical protein